MIPWNSNKRLSSAGFNRVAPTNRLARRLQNYFARHPEASREEFLEDAVGKEIDLRDQLDQRIDPWFARQQPRLWEVQGGPWFTDRPALTEEDVRLHAWIDERLVELHRERNGLWSRIRRFLFDNRLFGWLASNRREL